VQLNLQRNVETGKDRAKANIGAHRQASFLSIKGICGFPIVHVNLPCSPLSLVRRAAMISIDMIFVERLYM